ncbi:hypothetical protein [Mycobacterium deserti]|uniref:Uncharacterized protein n=1 Tax=Mycobacterium deserti TaxID=2978347 RepID=A0ABT2MB37_9MYCO|nr:hypothetical protein [Mycobacterium deserti]MCT7659482.1 hypothetical protein [Mycobacterium deserti]
MTKPEERGTRGTGSDEPSGGPVDRPSGTYTGDESVPTHDDGGKPDFETGFTNEPPKDVEPAIPPYEGRQTTAKPADGGDEGGERTGGAVKPVTDTDYKAASPDDTPGGATASPADEQPASQMPESDRDDDRAGPSHTAGTGRAEDKR